MRALVVVIGLAWIALSIAMPGRGLAGPKPKIAIAPLQGDPGNTIATAVVDALAGKDFVVVGPKEVSREIKKLGLAAELSPKDARKLAIKLDVAAVIDGDVTKSGGKHTLHLEVHRRGRPASGFTVEFKTSTSTGFHRAVHTEVVKKLEGAGDHEPAEADDDDDDGARKLAPRQAADDDDRKRTADDDRKRKLADDDATARRAKQRDDEAAAKRPRRDDDDDGAARRGTAGDRQRKRAAATDGDDQPAVRKRKGKKPVGDEIAPQPLARVAAGVSLAQRRLTFDTRGGFTQVPPRVITTAGAGRVDGEVYPFALASPDRGGSGLSGLGLAASYDKTFGLSIKLPNQSVQAPINQSHFSLGARYRFGIGEASTVALGLDYVGRHYIADRSGLMAFTLDAPDVDYSAVAPGIAARTQVTDTITAFAGGDVMLMLETGQIQETTSYGPATVYGVELAGGVDIAIAKQIGLRVALEYSQINFSFSNKGMLAIARDSDPATQDVMGAVDRSIGLAATLGLVY